MSFLAKHSIRIIRKLPNHLKSQMGVSAFSELPSRVGGRLVQLWEFHLLGEPTGESIKAQKKYYGLECP